jgi:hypothetical protein
MKAVLAAICGASPLFVVGVLSLFHVTADPTYVGAILGLASPILASIGVAVGPANKVVTAIEDDVAALLPKKTPAPAPAPAAADLKPVTAVPAAPAAPATPPPTA